MKSYELIHQIYNSCSGSALYSTDISELATDDLDAEARRICRGHSVEISRRELPDGSVVFDAVTDGLRQTLTFTEI